MYRECMGNGERKIGKIVIDRNLCIGAATCVVTAGDVFELDSENKAVVKLQGGAKNSGPVARKDLESATIDNATLLAAAQSCPTKAILVYDEDGKPIYP